MEEKICPVLWVLAFLEWKFVNFNCISTPSRKPKNPELEKRSLISPPGRYQRHDLFIKVLRVLCPFLSDASIGLPASHQLKEASEETDRGPPTPKARAREKWNGRKMEWEKGRQDWRQLDILGTPL